MSKHRYSIKAIRNGISVNYPVCNTRNNTYARFKIKEKKTSLNKCLRPDCSLYLMIDGKVVNKLK